MTQTALIEKDQGLLEPVVPISQPLESLESIHTIRSSPYHDKEHWLDLNKLTPQYRALSLALQAFEPRDSKYMFDPYGETFNIAEIISLARQYARKLDTRFQDTSMYVIVFRSILHEAVQSSAEKRQWLADIDKESHLEANVSGGLLKYWFGTPDDEHGQNLATCWWTSKEDAVRGGGGKKHREGMKKVRSWYKHWKVEEYKLVVNEDDFTFLRII